MQDDMLSAIDTFYDCVDGSFDNARAISAFSRATDDTGLCLVDITLTAKFTLLAYENIPEEAMLMMLNGPWTPENHGVLQNFAKIPAGIPVDRRAVQSDEEYYASELYNLAMVPWGLHSVGLCLLEKGNQGGLLNGFIRNPGQSEIDHELLSKMALLNEHLRRAKRLEHRIDKLEEALIQSNNALDVLEFGLALYIGSGAPAFVNKAARRIFDARDGLELVRSGISILDRSAQQQFNDLLQSLNSPSVPLPARAGGIVRVERPSRKKAYSLLVVPLKSDRNALLGNVGIAVLLFDPSVKRTTAIDLFAASYRLTRSESRLAFDLAAGVSLEEFSEKHGISRNTAKSHLHSIFAKTDTSRQPELVSLLLRSVTGINLD
ncbi:MAG: helix-turn-helix transcriptional regulator [Oricola sp.]